MKYQEAIDYFRKLLFYDFGFVNFIDEPPPPSQVAIHKLLQIQQQLELEEQNQQDAQLSPNGQSKEANKFGKEVNKNKEKGSNKMKEKDREKEREREEEERMSLLANLENTILQEKKAASEKEPYKNYPPPPIVYTNKPQKLFSSYEENIIIKFMKET